MTEDVNITCKQKRDQYNVKAYPGTAFKVDYNGDNHQASHAVLCTPIGNSIIVEASFLEDIISKLGTVFKIKQR